MRYYKAVVIMANTEKEKKKEKPDNANCWRGFRVTGKLISC